MLLLTSVGNRPRGASVRRARAVIRVQPRNDGPEARAVVHLAQVRQFVCHHVVDHRRREMDQPPVQANAGPLAATSPARTRRRQRQTWHEQRQAAARNGPCARQRARAPVVAQACSSTRGASAGERRQRVSVGSAIWRFHTQRLAPSARRIVDRAAEHRQAHPIDDRSGAAVGESAIRRASAGSTRRAAGSPTRLRAARRGGGAPTRRPR
jgi:hypothetical protein